jgi:3-dehydroquinate synthase
MAENAMSQVDVALGERSYPILIEQGLLDRAEEHLRPYARERRLIVVSDENVWGLLGKRLSNGLQGIDAVPLVLPAGEATKSWAQLERLIDRLLAEGVERKDTIIAFGGGVIGDITGLAAALTKRGCSYVQIPTTLLAQVDSSVGGKTAINAASGKNLVGAFHQPSAVLIDPSTLDTLPERDLKAGYAETVKYGLIGDPAFFAWCEAKGAALLAGDTEARLHAIETCIRTKAKIVAEDEYEKAGRRALLNFGHTFGHALEAETGFSDVLLHGEAVALGMVLAFRFSVEQGLCAAQSSERVAANLGSVGLPTTLAEARIKASGAQLAAHMAHDKKRSGSRLPFILTRGIGQAFVDESVELEEVAAFLNRQLSA